MGLRTGLIWLRIRICNRAFWIQKGTLRLHKMLLMYSAWTTLDCSSTRFITRVYYSSVSPWNYDFFAIQTSSNLLYFTHFPYFQKIKLGLCSIHAVYESCVSTHQLLNVLTYVSEIWYATNHWARTNLNGVFYVRLSYATLSLVISG
jgi:hypothetical protein